MLPVCEIGNRDIELVEAGAGEPGERWCNDCTADSHDDVVDERSGSVEDLARRDGRIGWTEAGTKEQNDVTGLRGDRRNTLEQGCGADEYTVGPHGGRILLRCLRE